MASPVFFVWIKYNGKPWPQIWYEEPIKSTNGEPRYKESQILLKEELTDKEKDLKLEQLVFIYPCPAERKEDAS